MMLKRRTLMAPRFCLSPILVLCFGLLTSVYAQLTGRLVTIPGLVPATGVTFTLGTPFERLILLGGKGGRVSLDAEGYFSVQVADLRPAPVAIPNRITIDVNSVKLVSQGLEFRTVSGNQAVSLQLHDMNGREMVRVHRHYKNPGQHIIPIDKRYTKNALGILTLGSGNETVHFKIGPHGAFTGKTFKSAAQTFGVGPWTDTLYITKDGYIKLSFANYPNSENLGQLYFFPIDIIR